MAVAHRRKVDAILVWRVDRFGLSLKHLVNALAELDAYGVALYSVSEVAFSASAAESCLEVRR
jgi:DNA invertase Pin-like site-specific DNA recombinase